MKNPVVDETNLSDKPRTKSRMSHRSAYGSNPDIDDRYQFESTDEIEGKADSDNEVTPIGFDDQDGSGDQDNEITSVGFEEAEETSEPRNESFIEEENGRDANEDIDDENGEIPSAESVYSEIEADSADKDDQHEPAEKDDDGTVDGDGTTFYVDFSSESEINKSKVEGNVALINGTGTKSDLVRKRKAIVGPKRIINKKPDRAKSDAINSDVKVDRSMEVKSAISPKPKRAVSRYVAPKLKVVSLRSVID